MSISTNSESSKKLDFPRLAVVPNHLAIIPDGNRRWARARGLPVSEGHRQGAKRIIELARFCRDLGIHTFTIWGFSTENWVRNRKEVNFLMRLFKKVLDEYLAEAKKHGTRIVHIGRRDRLPSFLRQTLENAELATKNNKKHVFNIALDYGGHDEIVRAVKRLISSNIDPQALDEEVFSSYLDTGDQPYPYVDLLIRTSGEQRLSGLFPWQMVYAEIWWDEVPLPDFDDARLVEALLDYSRRRRRFGGNDAVHKFDFRPSVVANFEFDWWRARNLHSKGEFKRAFASYVKEQFGISLSIAREAGEIFLRALIRGETEGDWKGTKRILTRFYKLIGDNVKLAFEPRVVAELEIDYLKSSNGDFKKRADLPQILEKLYAELFRISLIQARRVANLRVLAHDEEERAQRTIGVAQKAHLKQAEEYLVRSYEALKERVA